MACPNDIVEIAQKISDASQIISQFAHQQNVRLSMNPEDPDPASLSGPGSDAFHKARMTILEGSTTMANLLTGDQAPFTTMYTNFHAASAMRAVLKFGLAEAVPLEGSVSYLEVAEKTGLDATTVQRIFGVLIGHRVFWQPELGRVMNFGELYTFSHNVTDALVKWGPSQEPNETAFNYSRSTGNNFYEYLDHNKEAQSSFSKMMNFLASMDRSYMDGVYNGFNWEGMGEALVIDVAGSTGHVSVELARRYPNLQFLVQDYESVCRRGESLLPADLQDRVRFQAHDMFQDQRPVPDRKLVFFVRAILHNWSERYACRILRAILPALKPGDRIVLNERIMPEPGTAAPMVQHLTRASDMTMMSLFNGQERTAEQFKSLVHAAHPDLQVVQIRSPSPLAKGTVEISWKE